MKTNKKQFLSFAILICIVVLFGCEKESRYEFGAIQTEFEVDSIYKALSDGLLTVQYLSATDGGGRVKIYADFTDNPSSIIGQIEFPSTTTVPIRKNYYWKVVKGNLGVVKIGFTPIVNFD